VDRGVRVKLAGGREVEGTLKGFDPLLNLVLDEAREYLREDLLTVTDDTRTLGLLVCRGTAVMSITPTAGRSEIPNPFGAQEA
jgi:U6 snRNA-associated Sm-like protein LSm7